MISRDRKMASGDRIQEVLLEDRKAQRLLSLVTNFLVSLPAVVSLTRKTQASFKHGRAFAWIWLPQMWIKKQPRGSITVTFGLDRQVRDRRIKQSIEPYSGRHTQHAIITRAAEFDDQVKSWLREAHRVAGKPRNAHRRSCNS